MITYEKLASDKNDDTAVIHGGLSIKGLHLVLDLLERKRLSSYISHCLPNRSWLYNIQ